MELEIGTSPVVLWFQVLVEVVTYTAVEDLVQCDCIAGTMPRQLESTAVRYLETTFMLEYTLWMKVSKQYLTWILILYTHLVGALSLSGSIQFELVTAPNIDPPVFTLTCTSTGGPATTVTWMRDGTQLSDNAQHDFSQVVTDAESATYDNKLTVTGRNTGRNTGQYRCAVSNSRTSVIA